MQDTNGFVWNRIAQLIQSNAKGSTDHLTQIMGFIGETVPISRQSLQKDTRVSAHFTRIQDTPSVPPAWKSVVKSNACLEAQGYILQNFGCGLTPIDYFNHAKVARQAIATSTLSIAPVGYLQRKMWYSMGGVLSGNSLAVYDSNQNILQFLYGGNGWCGEWMIDLILIFLQDNDVQLMNKYMLLPSYLTSEQIFPLSEYEVGQILGNEMFLLREYRNECRRIQSYYNQCSYHKNKMSNKEILSSFVHLPFNLIHIVQNELSRMGTSTKGGREKIPLTVSLCIRLVHSCTEKIYLSYPVVYNRLVFLESLIYSTLSIKNVFLYWKLDYIALNNICNRIQDCVVRAFDHPKELVGVMAAQLTGQSSTQSKFDTHRAIAAELQEDIPFVSFTDIISATEKVSYPQMKVVLKKGVDSFVDIVERKLDYFLQTTPQTVMCNDPFSEDHLWMEDNLALMNIFELRRDHQLLTTNEYCIRLVLNANKCQESLITCESIVQKIKAYIKDVMNPKKQQTLALEENDLTKKKKKSKKSKDAAAIPTSPLIQQFAYLISPLVGKKVFILRLYFDPRSKIYKKFAQISPKEYDSLFLTTRSRARNKSKQEEIILLEEQEKIKTTTSAATTTTTSSNNTAASSSSSIVEEEEGGEEEEQELENEEEELPLDDDDVEEQEIEEEDIESKSNDNEDDEDEEEEEKSDDDDDDQDEDDEEEEEDEEEEKEEDEEKKKPINKKGKKKISGKKAEPKKKKKTKTKKKKGKKISKPQKGSNYPFRTPKDALHLLAQYFISNLTVSGIKNIKSAVKYKSKIFQTHEQTGEFEGEIRYLLITQGINFKEILAHPLVDPTYTITNCVRTNNEILGIIATQNFLQETVEKISSDYVDSRHWQQIVCTMCHRGEIVPLQRNGIINIKDFGTLHKSSFEKQFENYRRACRAGLKDMLQGPTEAGLVGKLINVGTGAVQVTINPDPIIDDENLIQAHMDILRNAAVPVLTELDLRILLHGSGEERVHSPDFLNEEEKYHLTHKNEIQYNMFEVVDDSLPPPQKISLSSASSKRQKRKSSALSSSSSSSSSLSSAASKNKKSKNGRFFDLPRVWTHVDATAIP
jgi:chemotaxis protein histidine kinase CheA